MKEHFNAILRSFAAALCSASLCLLTIALMLALYDIERTFFPACALWAILLLVQAIASEIMVSRSATMLVYLSVNAILVFLGARLVVENTLFVPGSHGFPMLLGWMVSACGMHLAYAAQKLPESNFFVRYADVLIAAIVFYLASVFALHESFHAQTLGFSLLALLLAMVTTAALRAGGESDSVIRGTGMGGYLVIGALVLVCLVLAALLLTLASGHVDGIVEAFLAVWHVVSGAVVQAFTVFVLFMSRLFGPSWAITHNPVVQQDTFTYYGGPMEEMGTAPQWVVYLVMGVIAALIIAAILAILWALRGTKISRTGKNKSRRKVTRTSRMGEALRALLAQAAGAITFELLYRANRHTPQGLYVYAVRTCRIKLLPKHKNESAGAYIRRLHQILLAQTGLSTLDRLADMLDHALYSGTKPRLGRGEADAFACQIRAIAPAPLIKSTKSE